MTQLYYGFGLGKPRPSAARSDPEGLTQRLTQSLDLELLLLLLLLLLQGPQRNVAKGLVWALVISSPLAGEACFGFQGWTPPWPAIWLVLIALVWDADREHTSRQNQ